MIHILIADDHAIVRQGLKQIVSDEKDIIVNGEAENSEGLFHLLRSNVFDIVILDINMPGRSGIDILKDISNEFPEIPVLVLSMYGEEQYGIRSIKAGASGYLKKASAPEELVKAIRKIVSGGKYISNTLAENMAVSFGMKKNQLPHENLSNREYEVFYKIASGKTAESIADEMSISIHTVYSFRNRILEKMNLKSNVELSQYALQNKLVE